MSAEVLPFPLARRPRSVEEAAARMAALDNAAAERYLKSLSLKIRKHWAARHVEPAHIDRMVADYRTAVHGALFRRRSRRGGAA
jgi:hypothetical protein